MEWISFVDPDSRKTESQSEKPEEDNATVAEDTLKTHDRSLGKC